MANIDIENISELVLNGDDLFQDPESFLTEISEENEVKSIVGGDSIFQSTPTIPCASLTDYQFTDSTVAF